MQAGRSETKRTRFEFLVWLDGSLTAAAQQPHGANRRYRFQFIHKVFGLRESPVGGGSCGALDDQTLASLVVICVIGAGVLPHVPSLRAAWARWTHSSRLACTVAARRAPFCSRRVRCSVVPLLRACRSIR